MLKIKKIISSILSASILAGYIMPTIVNAVDFENQFNYTDDIMVTSMLPLEEKNVYLILNKDDNEQLKEMTIPDILSRLQYSDGEFIGIDESYTNVWFYIKDENIGLESYESYLIDGSDDKTIDFSQSEGVGMKTVELIVGKGGQLNPSNIRYIVKIYYKGYYHDDISFELYSQSIDGLSRTKIEPLEKKYLKGTTDKILVNGHSAPLSNIIYSVPVGIVPNPYLSVKCSIDERPDVKVEIYEITDTKLTTPITEQVFYQNMNEINNGYRMIDNTAGFIALYYIDGIQMDIDILTFTFTGSYPYVTGELFEIMSDNKERVSYVSNEDINLINGVYTQEYVLGKDKDSNKEYYLNLIAKNGDLDLSKNITKVVIGHYDSLDDVKSLPDIKSQLFSLTDGFKADFSGAGIDFTLFFEDDVIYGNEPYKITIKTVNYETKIREYTDMPIIGEADPWFRITGAKDSNGELLDTYIIENGKNINVDTMYGYGYQSVFINENVDNIEPTFWIANSEYISIDSIYVNGKRFNAGDTISFVENEDSINAIFSVIINDSEGKHTKNYNVSFIKKTNGSKLYVAGPLSPDVRSVFLDEYFEHKHDIFIANIGSEPINDLRVELDAENVKLDSYWTIGGAGNDMLLPCTDNFSAELESTKYGELSNVAKIRLIPDGDNGGEINGTLKIYSGSELLKEITLSGMAQNPEIITSEIDDAVLYVPYSYLVTTNNMYDWTTVDFEINGKLPDGVEFYTETGEIYGVPLETGEFTFDITANFTSDTYSFDSSTETYTLVVNDNTNYNVYTATDDDYTLLNTIGTDIGGYDFVLDEIGDELFRSEGVIEQFVGLWLNGELLEEGVDYDAESGSTKITVYAQTFENRANQDGINTIAAEFRTADTSSLNTLNNTNELKVTAQNFRLDLNSDIESPDVICSVRILDPSGDTVSNLNLELRSKPQNTMTNDFGIAKFKPIGFGNHTLYVKNDNGNIIAQKSFEILSSNEYNVKDDAVTAVKGSSFTLDVEYDGNQLKLLPTNASIGTNATTSTGSEDINKNNATSVTTVVANSNNVTTSNKDNSAKISNTNENDKAELVLSPDTGDNFDVWKYIYIIICASAIIGICMLRKVKKEN